MTELLVLAKDVSSPLLNYLIYEYSQEAVWLRMTMHKKFSNSPLITISQNQKICQIVLIHSLMSGKLRLFFHELVQNVKSNLDFKSL